MRNGFTLVEVAVALVILSVGVAGAAAMVTVAARTLAAAREREFASALIWEVADSLAWAGVAGSGTREDDRGLVVWTVEAAGSPARVRLQATVGKRSFDLQVVALLPVGRGSG